MRKLAFFSTLLLLYTASFTHAKIVFVSAQEICVMDDDGSNIQKLTHNNVYDSNPRWSPNGKYIAFIRAQKRVTNEQNHDIFIMNRDGSGTKQLTYYTGLDGQPTWSPDSQTVAFASTRLQSFNIYTVNIQSRREGPLTRDKKRLVMNNEDWSPDGKQIAYTQVTPPAWKTVYIMDIDSQKVRQFVPGDGKLRYSVRWSPDGEYILYCEAAYGPPPEFNVVLNKVVIRKKHGSLVKELKMPSPEKWFINSACWMGTEHLLIDAKVDYQTNRKQHDIYRYNLAAGQITNLTNSANVNDGLPHWIDDKTLPVEPLGKLTTQWGQLKLAD